MSARLLSHVHTRSIRCNGSWHMARRGVNLALLGAELILQIVPVWVWSGAIRAGSSSSHKVRLFKRIPFPSLKCFVYLKERKRWWNRVHTCKLVCVRVCMRVCVSLYVCIVER